MTPLGFIKPELPTLVPEPPTEEGWIHEIKYDGYRTLIAMQRKSGQEPGQAIASTCSANGKGRSSDLLTGFPYRRELESQLHLLGARGQWWKYCHPLTRLK
jgi:hypothetical protein